MREKPSVIDQKQGNVKLMDNYIHRNMILGSGVCKDHTKLELVTTKSGDLTPETLSIFDVFDEYHVIGSVTACGHWDGRDDIIDPWYDVHRAIRGLPVYDKPFFLIMNPRTKSLLHCVDYDRKPFYESIIPLFCHVCPVNEDIRRVVLEDLKDVILRTSVEIPYSKALVVSDNNSIIIINDC